MYSVQMFFILNSISFSKSRIVRVQLYCVKCDSEVNVFFVEKIHTNFDEPTRQIFKQKFVLIINFVSAMYYSLTRARNWCFTPLPSFLFNLCQYMTHTLVSIY